MKKLESGRSMVEMLGVLAIIGVLSIGGIAGYTLSMRRHRANKAVDALNKYALLIYDDCQKQLARAEVSDMSACRGIGKMSEVGIDGGPDLIEDLIDMYGVEQKNNVDYVRIEVKVASHEICRAIQSVMGSMASKDCLPENNWLTVRIPQN